MSKNTMQVHYVINGLEKGPVELLFEPGAGAGEREHLIFSYIESVEDFQNQQDARDGVNIRLLTDGQRMRNNGVTSVHYFLGPEVKTIVSLV